MVDPSYMTLFTFKFGLVSFWAIWQLLVFMTNLFEGLKLLRIVPPYWKFASQNYQAVAQATGAYKAPPWMPQALFLGVLVWQLGILFLFGRAVISAWSDRTLLLSAATEAFAASLSLLAAFMIADEVFKQYEVERAHILFFTAQLLTLLTLYMLPA
jgi:hypothetical protein